MKALLDFWVDLMENVKNCDENTYLLPNPNQRLIYSSNQMFVKRIIM